MYVRHWTTLLSLYPPAYVFLYVHSDILRSVGLCSRYFSFCRSNWARSWIWWVYLRNYFPLRLVKTVELDPTNTYMLCVFPHGVLSTGAFFSFATEASEFCKLFPGLRPYLVTLAGHFIIPFIRELSLALGKVGVCVTITLFLR
jgi:hypothetical protein